MESLINKGFYFIKKFTYRNRIILDDFNRIAGNNTVNLHWWRPQGPVRDTLQNNENLGDYLAVPILDYLLQIHCIKDNVCNGRKHLYTVGSIIFMGLQDAVIWGSGLLYENSLPYFVKKFKNKLIKLDIRAVRGPKTREILCKYGYNCPEIYGDPAILMPLIYNPVHEKKYEYTIIHHMDSNELNEGVSILTKDYKGFIDRIVKSKLIISGSLHGIILAEAYGVPAILLLDRKNINMFKYEDYYFGTGRKVFPVARNVREALTMTKLQPPDFSKMQEKLLDAFPVDLWK